MSTQDIGKSLLIQNHFSWHYSSYPLAVNASVACPSAFHWHQNNYSNKCQCVEKFLVLFTWLMTPTSVARHWKEHNAWLTTTGVAETEWFRNDANLWEVSVCTSISHILRAYSWQISNYTWASQSLSYLGNTSSYNCWRGALLPWHGKPVQQVFPQTCRNVSATQRTPQEGKHVGMGSPSTKSLTKIKKLLTASPILLC